MISFRRLLAGVAALLTVSMVAAGCDSSPSAASINGHVVRQTALNAELRQFGDNTYYVKLAKQGVVTAPVTVAGTGTGNYSSEFAAAVLTQMIIATAAHQQVARTHTRPDAAQYAATRAVDGILYGPGAWGSFSPSFRTTLVDQDADLAMVEANGISLTQLRTVQTDYSTQLFTRVCVRTVAVHVNGSNGSVDFGASLTQAKAVAASIEASPSTATPGSLTCYSQAGLESESLAYVLSVLDLATGKAAAPQKTASGYRVTAVTSRTQIPSDIALARAFTVAINQNKAMAAQAVAPLLSRTSVKVNPGYGTWTKNAKGVFGVTPTSAPSGGVAT